jgi:ankyrin repeat protein
VAVAVRAGRHEVARLLRAHGAPEGDLRPVDALIGACVRLDADAAHATAASDGVPDGALSLADLDLIAAAARAGAVEHLRLMFDVGLPAGRAGTAGVTPLHLAAWHGRVDVARLLLDRGAPTDARDHTYDATPAQWAEHGSVHCRTADEEYRAVGRMLAAQ